MNDIIKFHFEHTPIHVLRFKGREVWTAQEVAVGLGYSDPKHFTDKINGDWSEEFEEGVDFFKAEGEDLAALKRLVGESPTSGGDPVIHPRTPSLILLTESGVHLACTLARTERGKLFRRWLARKVLPVLRQLGAMAPAPQEQLAAVESDVALRSIQLMRKVRRISAEQMGVEVAALYERITGRAVALPENYRALLEAAQGGDTPPGAVKLWLLQHTEHCHRGTVSTVVYDRFALWCLDQGMARMSRAEFAALMQEHGFCRRKTGGHNRVPVRFKTQP